MASSNLPNSEYDCLQKDFMAEDQTHSEGLLENYLLSIQRQRYGEIEFQQRIGSQEKVDLFDILSFQIGPTLDSQPDRKQQVSYLQLNQPGHVIPVLYDDSAFALMPPNPYSGCLLSPMMTAVQIEQLELPDPVMRIRTQCEAVHQKKLSGDDRRRIGVIQNLWRNQSHAIVLSLEKLTELLWLRMGSSSSYLTEKARNKILKKTRNNQTRTVSSWLRLMSLAFIGLVRPTNNHSLNELPHSFTGCISIDRIQQLLRSQANREFSLFLNQFLSREELTARLFSDLEYDPIFVLLVLETLPVIHLILNSEKIVNSWDLQKIQARGAHPEAIKKLDLSGSLPEITEILKSEYLEAKPKLKQKSCSSKNNMGHYFAKYTLWMLESLQRQIQEDFAGCSELTQAPSLQKQLDELRSMREQLMLRKSKTGIKSAITKQWVRQRIRSEFLQTRRLLRHVLMTDTVNIETLYFFVLDFERFEKQFESQFEI